MSWRDELEKLLRDQMPYAFLVNDEAKGQRPSMHVENFQDALGYILEFVEVERKKSFFAGYAEGGWDATYDWIKSDVAGPNTTEDQMIEKTNQFYNKDLSRVGAERAWLKKEAE